MRQAVDKTVEKTDVKSPARHLFWLLPVAWLLVLAGFVTTPVWITLSIAGPLLLRGGFSLARSALPHVKEGVAYLGVFLVGLLMLLGAAATLAPGMPASWLTGTAMGLGLLDSRAGRLENALDNGDAGLAGRLAERGLGTGIPVDGFGSPLLFSANRPDLLAPLLNAGLSPDAVDGEGRTYLMRTHEEDIARLLLAAGADTEIRDFEGRTALFHARGKGPEHVGLLLEAGADAHAVDHAGFTVADVYPAEGELRELLESHAGENPLPAPRTLLPTDRGRRDWLAGAVRTGQSQVTLTPAQPAPGDVVRVDIHIANDRPDDRLLQVSAMLGGAAYLVGASHDGRPENPGLANTWRRIRWPLMTLPANAEGVLNLDIVARRDTDVGDLGLDVFYRDVGATEDTVFGVSHPMGYSHDESGAGFWITMVLTLVGGAAVIVAVQLWIIRRGMGSAASRGALLGAAICWLILLSLVVGAVEPWLTMEETECEVLDRRVRLETTRSTSSGTGRSSGSSVYAVPMLAVRYPVAGEQWISTGFNADMGTRTVGELRDFSFGDRVACWFDPDDPTRFTVARAPGVGLVMGVIMTLLCALVFTLIHVKLRHRNVRLRPRT